MRYMAMAYAQLLCAIVKGRHFRILPICTRVFAYCSLSLMYFVSIVSGTSRVQGILLPALRPRTYLGQLARVKLTASLLRWKEPVGVSGLSGQCFAILSTAARFL